MRAQPLEQGAPVVADWRRREEELKAERAEVLESITEGFVHLDADWRFTYVNAAAERIYAFRREDLLGRSFWEVFPEALDTAFEPEYRRVMAERVPVRVEGFYKPLSRWFEVYVVPARDGGLAFYFRDISGRKQAAALLKGQNQALELALHGAPLGAVLDVLARTVEAQSADGVLASILLLDAGGSHLRHGAAPSLPEAYVRAIDGLEIGPGAGSCGAAAYAGRTIVAEDIARDPLWAGFRDLAREHRLGACWSTPIRSSQGPVLGTFALYYREARQPAERDREVVERLLHTAAIVIERRIEARERRTAEEALRSNEQRYRQLLEALPAAVYTCDAAGRVTLYNEAAALLWGRRPEIGAERWCGSLRMYLPDGTPLPLDRCPMAEALQEGRTLHAVELVVERPDGERRHVLAHPQPLLDDAGDVLGAINILIDITERKRAEDELAATKDDLARQVHALTRLHSLAMRLAGPLTLQPALQAILETLVAVHGADLGLLSLHDPASGCLRPEASVGFSPQALAVLAGVRPGPDMGACGTAFATRQRVIVGDAGGDPCFESFRALAREAGFRSVHSTPVLTRSGEILGVLSVHFAAGGRRPTRREMQLADLCARHAADAIESARTEEARRQAEEQLREADRRKDEFLATLAHELRNPLAPIRNSLHILRLSGGSGAAARIHEMMERQVGHLVRLVDDLLEISRITRGKIELCKERVDLAAVVHSAVETSRPLVERAGHRLTVRLPPEPLNLEADPVRLAQVIANLLNNAAKFTDPGGQIWLTAEREGASVKLSVRDTGIGMAADMLPRVFDMFAQLDRSPARAQDGLGIGLTLVRGLVQMHGGSVEAKSEGPGRGSELIVRLPLAAGQPAAGPEPGPACSQVLARRRVLLVDDNRDAADSLGMLLGLLGAEVQAVYDGAAALAALEAYRPAAVLLDIGMPGMDGYEVARRIRQQERLRDLPIIALTGWGQEEDRRRARAAGFDHHLIKPVDLDALQALLASLDTREAEAPAGVQRA